MCADIIKNCHSSLSAAEFAQTTKVALQKAYTECLEFLIFRALPVILTDDLQQRVDIIQSNIIGIVFKGSLQHSKESFIYEIIMVPDEKWIVPNIFLGHTYPGKVNLYISDP